METPTLPYESDSTVAISAALVACQGALRPALKDANNPVFKTRYADLASVMEAIREPMLENGLAIQHQQLPGEAGRLVLRTVLRHKSGEFLASVAVVPLSKQDAQGMGSALTYARRYGVAAMLGVVQDDDDGNAASTPQAKPAAAKPVPAQQPAARPPVPPTPPAAAPVTEARIAAEAVDDVKRELLAAAGVAGLTWNHVGQILKDQFNAVKVADLTPSQVIRTRDVLIPAAGEADEDDGIPW
jgi:hypothetical protein